MLPFNRFRYLVLPSMLTTLIVMLWLVTASVGPGLKTAYAQATPTPIPGLTFPLVADSAVAGYFDHKQTSAGAGAQLVQFYNGRANPSATAGFMFTCPAKNHQDWVGCTSQVSGEPSCPNSEELWYDDHGGTDFEYFPDWHTGATCDLNKFQSRTYIIPLFAPALGKVIEKEVAAVPGLNGFYYIILFDINRNGNFADDNVKV